MIVLYTQMRQSWQVHWIYHKKSPARHQELVMLSNKRSITLNLAG